MTKTLILTQVEEALNLIISNTGTLSSQELNDASNALIQTAFTVNPDSKPTPVIKF